MPISTMVSSTDVQTAKSTAIIPSNKEKEKAITDITDFLSTANPWLYKEFCLAKQVQLKEYLQASDMYSDMKRPTDLYSGVMQVANSWKPVQYHDRTKCALPKHPAVIQENDILINYFELMYDPPALLYAMRMEEIELPRFYVALYSPHTEPADQMTYIQIVKQIGEWWEKAEGLWKEWIAVIHEVEQKKTVKEFTAAVGEFKARMRAWKRHMHVLSDDDDEDDDDDKEDEDDEEPAGTSRHQGPDDDDDNDDAGLPGIDFDHTNDTGASGGSQDHVAQMTYKKCSTVMVSSIGKKMAISSAMVPSTGTKMAISTSMVSSSKGKEMVLIVMAHGTPYHHLQRTLYYLLGSQDVYPIAEIYPLAQIDYTRLVRFLVLLCEEDDEDTEDDWIDVSHGMTDDDFIYLDDDDRSLALGLPPNL
ncbi:hypothetical protein L7F22_001146 [Adiantum nelumboides]|nr:hypothetical protein [Adiantum nelumboides]